MSRILERGYLELNLEKRKDEKRREKKKEGKKNQNGSEHALKCTPPPMNTWAKGAA